MRRNWLKFFQSACIVAALVGGYQLVRHELAPDWSRTASCPSLPDSTVAHWCFNGKTDGAKWSISIGTLQGSLIHQTPVLGIDFKGLHNIASSCDNAWSQQQSNLWLKDALVIPIIQSANLKVDNGPSGGVAKHAGLVFATPKTYHLNLGSYRAEVENRLELIYGDGQNRCVDQYQSGSVWWVNGTPDSTSLADRAQKNAPKTERFQIVRQTSISDLLGYYVIPHFGKTKFSTYMENHAVLEISHSCFWNNDGLSSAATLGSGPGLNLHASSVRVRDNCSEKRPQSFLLPLLQGQSNYLQY
jgi:hypothetical protein